MPALWAFGGSSTTALLLGGEDRGGELVLADRGSVLAFASLPVEVHPVEPASLTGRYAEDTLLDFAKLVSTLAVKRYASGLSCFGFRHRQTGSLRVACFNCY